MARLTDRSIEALRPRDAGEAIEQACISVRRALKPLRRQEASLNLLYWRARKRETPEQHARLVEKNMRRIYACQAEDRALAEGDEPDDGDAA